MKKFLLLSLVSAFLFAISSCTITKRHFRKGYHVEWNKKNKIERETNTLTKTEVQKEKLTAMNSEAQKEKEDLTLTKTKTLIEVKSEEATEKSSEEVISEEENIDEETSPTKIERKKVFKTVESRDPNSDDSNHILRIVLGIILVILIGPYFIAFGVLLFLLIMLLVENLTISSNYALTEAIGIGTGGVLTILYFTTGLYLIFKLFSRKETDPEKYRKRRNLQWLIALIAATVMVALIVIGFYFL